VIYTVDSTRKFLNVRNGSQEVCAIKYVTFTSAPASNLSIIAAVTGKKIRVVQMFGQSSDAAIGAVRFESPAGTTIVNSIWLPLATTAGQLFLLPHNESGWFESATGEAIVADIATDDVNVTLGYIEYTP
jgi:hypothetical protein